MIFSSLNVALRSERARFFLRPLKWIWIVFLAWVVIGGTLGEILALTDFIGPSCEEKGKESGIYPICEPCKMHGMIFGVFEANNCPNALTQASLEYGIALPRLFVVCVSLFVFIFVDLLSQVSRILPPIVLIPATLALLARTIVFNFVTHKNMERGLHRSLLAGWLVLATIAALQG